MRIKKSLLVLTSLAIVLSACSNEGTKPKEEAAVKEVIDNINESGMPIVKESIELNIFAGQTPQSAEDWNDVMIWNEYEKMTGIDIKWEMIPSISLDEKRNLALASGRLPDAFHTAGIPTVDLLKYGEQGTFIKLNDLIEEHAPNLTALFEQYPEVKKAITFPDGNIYSFPTIVEPNFLSMRIGPKPWVNNDWLEALNMKMPETTDEYYEYLKAVKEQDPNGNGKADEIPFGSYSIGMLLRWVNGSFGLGNRGFNHPYIDMNPKEEELRFIPTSDEYKAALQYVNKLFSEGLIEQNIFSMESEQFLANASEGLYGSTVSHGPTDLFPKDAGKAFASAPALEGPFGDKLIAGMTSSVSSIGGFVITNKNQNPIATVKWMDYLYSDEGAKLFLMGIEGETYEVTPEGDLQYLDKIVNSVDGLSFEQELAKYLTWPGGGYPGIVKEEIFKGLENSPESAKAAENLKPYVLDEAWPSFTYTIEENEKLSSIGVDVEKYVIEMRDKFIAGDIPFSEWENYLKTLESMGLEEYMDIKKTALERFRNS